jgi:hypothetical protein
MAENTGNIIEGLAIAGVAIWGISKLDSIFGSGSPNDPKQQDFLTQLDKEILATPGTGTYSEAQFDQFGDLLQAAMEGMGTDENAIYSVMDKMQSKLDVLLLIKAFGIRYYQEFLNVGENYTLDQWFQNELSQSAIDDINAGLAAKGIVFYF